MVKSCVAFGCSNRSVKGSELTFYRFPANIERRKKWIAAVRREKWTPTKHSWLCSSHFISGSKSDDPLNPDYVPSLFQFVASPVKRRKRLQLQQFCRRKKARLSRAEATSHDTLVSGSSEAQLGPQAQVHCEPEPEVHNQLEPVPMSEVVPVGHGPQAQVHSEPEPEVQGEPEVHQMELELEPVTTPEPPTKSVATQTDLVGDTIVRLQNELQKCLDEKLSLERERYVQ